MRAGEHVVLKLGDDTPRRREGAALRLYSAGGGPACRILAEDDVLGGLLLERILLGDDLRQLSFADDDAATAVAGSVIGNLHAAARASAPTQPAPIPRLGEILTTFDPAGRPRAVAAGLAGELFDRGAGLAAELVAPVANDVVLHGDAHHANILRDGYGDGADVWRAIDPHGWWGDPTFDTAAFMLNPFDVDVYAATPLATARRRAGILADAIGLDPDRILAWTFTGAVISELWCLQDHGFIQGAPARLAAALADTI